MDTQISTVSPGDSALQRSSGEGRLSARLGDRGTEIAALYQDGCAKIRLPRSHTDALQAVLMNTAGGLTGGDRLRWSAMVGAGARLVLTTPACERVYRSLGQNARLETSLEVAAGGQLDWLPQETILYERSRLDRTLEVDLEQGATFTAVEAVLLGRLAMGENAADIYLHDSWRVRLGGRLVHAEATRLGAEPRERIASSLLAGARAFATVLHVSAQADRRLDAVRKLLPETAGASLSNERLTVRLLALDGLSLRRSLAPIIALLSSAGSVPRLWSM